jgi:hypothetical protein
MKTRYSDSFIIKLLCAVVFSSIALIVSAQETSTCAENLKTAQSLFDKGQVDQVSAMLVDCMKKGFKREEQIAAYKLLIQSYLFEDKLPKADSTMLTFLKKYPEYQLSPTDHSSFVNLFNSFKVKSVIQIVFHIGTNMPFLTNVHLATVSSEPVKKDYSKSFFNLYASLEAKYALSRKFEVNVEGGYSQSSFSSVENFLGFGNTNYTETQYRIEVPVTTTYNIISLGKFTPYLRAGIGAAFDISSSAKATFIPTDINNSDTHTGPDIDRNDSRIFMDLFGQAGIGLKFKTTRGYLNFEVRSNFGFLNQTIRGSSSAETLRWEYYYVDDDFNLNNLNITLGYTQIFYKPSKRK